MLYLYQHSAGGTPFYVGVGTRARAGKVHRKDNPRHLARAAARRPHACRVAVRAGSGGHHVTPYWLTFMRMSTVWTAPASFTATWIGTDLRFARSACDCVSTEGAYT